MKGMTAVSLLKSSLFRNTSTLVLGTVIAQAIPIILSPFLRRMYSPEAYGAYSVYLSMLGILFVLSSFRYEMAIVLPRSDRQAKHLLFLSQSINLLFCLALFVLTIAFQDELGRLLNIPQRFRLFLLFIPLGTFLYNLYQAFHYYLIRQKRFVAVSVNKSIRRGSEGMIQLGAQKMGSSGGLLAGDITGHLLNCVSGAVQTRRAGLFPMRISWSKLRYVARKYNEFPRFNMLSSFMGAFSFLFPAILINKFFGASPAGQYDLSKLVLSIPLVLIAGAIANVLLQRFSDKRNRGESIQKDFLAVLTGVSVLAVLEIAIISLWGSGLFTFVFGDQWKLSGNLSEILVWSYALNFITFSFSSVFISLNQIKLLAVWQLLHFLLIGALLAFPQLAFMQFVRLYVSLEVLCLLLNLILLFYIVYRYERSRSH